MVSRGVSYNVGTGKGFSVREVTDMAKTVTGIDIPVLDAARREGDPDVLVANVERSKRHLAGKPNIVI